MEYKEMFIRAGFQTGHQQHNVTKCKSSRSKVCNYTYKGRKRNRI